ncbi:hypothetical protein BASA82_000082 [Batrachochytrium salamandrivorans]|nr:hypothetical protein BASA81_000760 [Batrachochytrium salamandrivorans]KAH9262899.1 hypothetical protein BASA82_000082 [Batrachochytrium salamandrivorans]
MQPAVSAIGAQFTCSTCSSRFASEQFLQEHTKGRVHLAMVKSRQASAVPLASTQKPAAALPLPPAVAPKPQRPVAVSAQTWDCELCNFQAQDHYALLDHAFSLRHQKKLGSGWSCSGEHVCFECRFNFNGPHPLMAHLASAKHAAKVRAKERQLAPKRVFPCKMCNLVFDTAKLLREHHKSLEHSDLVLKANQGFESLDQMNVWLQGLILPMAESKTQARLALKKVHINISDLVRGKYEMCHPTVSDLRRYTIQNGMIFPKHKAKSEGLKVFLRKFHLGRQAAVSA